MGEKEEKQTEKKSEEGKKKNKERKKLVVFFVVFFSHLEGDIKFSSSIFNDQSICVTFTLVYFINESIFFLTKFIICLDLIF